MTVQITTPGRDVWSLHGGTTPYYELTADGVANVGAEPTVDFWHTAVTYGVKAIQNRINELGYTPKLLVDGDFGAKTKAAVLWVQGHKLGFTGTAVDGVVGRATAKALFLPIAKAEQTRVGIPGNLLLGGVDLESSWDPGAQGSGTPFDLGLQQKNTKAYASVTWDMAFDAHWSLGDFANEMGSAYGRYLPSATSTWKTEQLRRQCAAGHHFAPTWADTWWSTGTAPLPKGYTDLSPEEQKKVVTIEKYANAVLARAANFS
jgi:peptidoglycan hydrolase-like protein with peptidoglycan-binding domain